MHSLKTVLQDLIKDERQMAHKPAFRSVGVLYHPKLAEARVLAAEMLEFIENQGVSAWGNASWRDEGPIKYPLEKTDFLITIGGDGSVLRAARMTAHYGIPVLGVNMGHLGFLTEVQPAEWAERVEQILIGDYWVEKRTMIQVKHYRHRQKIGAYEALNEMVIGRGGLSRVVRLHTHINGGFLTTYTADGLIVATSTGSTAYALSAGGPILTPELENILLIPLAPHLSLERAIVLSGGAVIHVRVSTDHTGLLTVDGQFEIELADDDELTLGNSPWVGRFVRLRARNYFYRTLLNRLGGM
jgi:NAD+ kinase